MKNKIYEFIMLILHWLLYGISIGCVIFNGLQDGIEIAWFICVSILVIARTFTATITLLTKEQEMKDKENKIDEMVSVMAASNNPFVDVPVEIMPKVAEALYNAGYRKLPKDSIVLSREEYEQHANEYKNLSIKYDQVSDKYRLCKDANEGLKQKAISASKETAEKIYTFVNSFGTNNWERFKEFIKQFGVEIKE